MTARSRSVATVVRVLALAALAGFQPAPAHEGPPFPILVDQRAGPYVASIWADPDIGTGDFFVLLDPPPGRSLPAETRVRVAVQPASGRLEEAVYPAEPQRVRHGARYFAEVPFDRGEIWRVRILLEGSEGSGELHAEVEPTPPGSFGMKSLLLYLAPFLAVGFLWLKAALHRRRRDANIEAEN